MTPHSSTLAWKIPWTEEPDRLQSMGLLGVGHDWATSLSLFTFMHWRRIWQPTPVFLPGESRDGGAWWAAVSGVAQSRTWLKWLSSSSQSYGFSSIHVRMWELGHKECWVPKDWCFQTVMLEKTLESPLDRKEINQPILKEINSEYSLEGLMLKLKLQYFGYLMRRSDSLEKTLMLEKI